MKEKFLKALRGIRSQSVYEMVKTLEPVREELHLAVNHLYMIPPSEAGIEVVLLDFVYVVLVTDTHVFLLYRSRKLHTIDRRTKLHKAVDWGGEPSELWELFYEACMSHKRLLRQQKAGK